MKQNAGKLIELRCGSEELERKARPEREPPKILKYERLPLRTAFLYIETLNSLSFASSLLEQ